MKSILSIALVFFVSCGIGCAKTSGSSDTNGSSGTGSGGSGGATTPATPTFTDNANGTIGATATTTTGALTWMKCVQGQTYSAPNCTGGVSTFQYCSADDQSCNNTSTKLLNGTGTSQAYTTCNNLNSTPPGGFAGKTTWRVPKKEELKSLVVCSNGPTAPLADLATCNGGSTLPTMNTAVFPSVTATAFWSATESVSAGFANYTCLGSSCFGVAGATSSTNNTTLYPVRCVAD